MRIGLFFWSLELGGVEHMMVELARALVERGHSVTLILARAARPDEYLPDPRIGIVRLGCATTPRTILKLAVHLSSLRYDLLYTAMPTTNIAAIAAISLARVPTKLVISERSNPVLEARHAPTWRYRAAFTLQPFVYPLADAIVAVSAGLADALAKSARLSRDTIRVIYNPAFCDDAGNKDRPALHPWLLDKDRPVILAAGRLMAQKDFATLIRAFALVRAQRPARLIILGEGPERPRLEALLDELGLESDVAMPGYRSDIRPFLAEADVFALTSIWEGFGNVLVEALGAGCSIVSTDCPDGPAEILADGRYGTLVAVGDEAGLCSALIRALDRPFDPQEQRQRARHFSVARSADAYETLFQHLVGAR
ncbi:Glycosyltransferase involved in cell wall bisynthesis [Devosia crocina]|uniref:Glycosyltransferase involved in cell wall bisynthesis n=2 Tax=Devosia crocina TaxID=429728 RepID=A0A1I7N1H6_9HYPH|nr:Glycosyltransferase involved in cell wall bisynthesis [Devosia crocina]